MPLTALPPLPRAERSGRRRALAAALGAALALAGCNAALSPTGAITPLAAPGPLAEAPNPVAAEQHARIVAAYGGVYRDEKLEITIARLVGRLVESSDDPSRSYRITILNAGAINAFALPDGYLYVTRGLLTLANDSSEVAAVLAHEMAHVTADHATQRMDRVRTADLVGRVVTDVIDDAAAGRLALASSQSSLASFSRQQELEADSIGIRTLGRAGYDPFAAARFLQSMSRFGQYRAATGIQQEQRPEFLASHPNNPQRIEAAQRSARQFGAPGLGEVDRERYLAGIDGTVFGDDSAQGYVRGRSFLHAGLGIGFTVPEGFVIDNTRQAVLATGPDGTALRFDAVSVPAGTGLADYLASGWVNGLDPASVAAATIGGLPAATASASARGWEFRIAVVRASSATYRFIFANEDVTPGFVAAAASTPATFRELTAAETAALRPLRLRVLPVAPGDTPQSMAARMSGVDRPLELFLVLNGLGPDSRLEPGTRVKIVTD